MSRRDSMNAGLYILALVFGYLGYREAAQFAGKHGRTPWDLPAWVWGVLTAGSFVIGAILLLVARRTTSPIAGAGPAGGQPVTVPPQPGPPQARPAALVGRDILPR